MRRSLTFLILLCNILLLPLPAEALAKEGETGEGSGGDKCPLADLPPPPNRPADMPALIKSLKTVGVDSRDGDLHAIFFSDPAKTKLEQFFQLMWFIQRQRAGELPVVVERPGIADVLLAAKVFTNPDFPNRIVSVRLEATKGGPRYQVHFDAAEIRFPLNQGIGFATWDFGKCQLAKELVFHDGFGFSLSQSGKNLMVQDFDKVQLYGDFGSRGLLDVDLNYVDLERVEFIAGTDRGKVKTRVAKREFTTNPHSTLFRWIGRLIPDWSEQRIDW